jgi:hypothetical protein
VKIGDYRITESFFRKLTAVFNEIAVALPQIIGAGFVFRWTFFGSILMQCKMVKINN